MPVARPEHPRPQFRRDDWVNLNGTWTFAFDWGRSGTEAGWSRSSGFDSTITVPFCPESRLSGVGHTDFIEAMWYHRLVEIPAGWQGRRVWLHFGGVDYECEVFIDGHRAGRHFGGTVGFGLDISALVTPGQRHNLVVRVADRTRGANQPGGKQSVSLRSRRCHYTRTTGIWQTVWLEAIDANGLAGVSIVPDLDGSRFVVTPTFHGTEPGLTWTAVLSDGDEVVAQATEPAAQGAAMVLPVAAPRPWSPGDPHLYDLVLEVRAGDRAVDRVGSYAGLRKIHIEGNRIYLNNRPIFLRLVLDQGYYPDGIWTAPTDGALKRDIELAMAAGFHGARLHQKVFEERFHYWADRLGYLTWGESSSWGADVNTIAAARNFLSEWQEIVRRDRNHPSVMAWTPFNETRGVTDRAQHARLQIDAYNVCKALDPTRPVNDASGYVHEKTDLWTVHSYAQDPVELRETLTPQGRGAVYRNYPDDEIPYTGQPYVVDEYGGMKWNPKAGEDDGPDSWGYGRTPKDLDEFYARLEALTDVLLSLDHVSGYCYTQLTDIEQEQNGIYYYDRTGKFDMARIRAIFSRKPEWARESP